MIWGLIFLWWMGCAGFGLGRTLETRAESETHGQYRVAISVYDLRGNPSFQTLSYTYTTRAAIRITRFIPVSFTR